MLIILGIIGGFWVIVLTVLMRGWVFKSLWAWFMVPIFGLPLLSIPQALGLSLIVTFLTHQTSHAKDERGEKAKMLSMFAEALLSPLFALLIGWIFHSFIK